MADNWSIETVATANPDTVDMELGPDGLIHIVFHDEITGNNSYLRRDSSGTYTDLNFPYLGHHLQLDFEPANDHAYVLYIDRDSGDFMLAWQDFEGNWDNKVVSAAHDAQTLCFEQLNYEQYFAYTRSTGEVRYGFADGGGSLTTSMGVTTGSEVPEVSLALRSDGAPRLSYNLDGVLYYAKTTNLINWTSTVIDDSSNAVGLFSSLALDSSDNPSISYHDDWNTDLKYAWYNSFSSSWTISMIDGLTSSTGDLTSMALDPRNDYPKITYRGIDCSVCLSELVSSGLWIKTEVSDVLSRRRKIRVNSQGDTFILFEDGDNDLIRLAVDYRRIFSGGFETASTDEWDTTSPQ
ncbi:MAG: hypothetical protein DRJ65_05620 [Acidobacteria bacterium]|nr:MAG: hypothetical protein DRJ65_05620 [Acidobacteriota bacterium]